MSSSAAVITAARGARLLLQQAGVATHPPHHPFAAATAIAANAHRSLRSSAAPGAAAAEEQQQQQQRKQQQQQQPQLSPQRIAAYDFARQTFGAVLDRYNPSAQLALSPLSPFSAEGRAALKRRFGDLVSKGVVISHLNRKVPGFSLGELKGNVAALYEQVNGALASGQRGLAAAEDAVASGELQRLRGDAHARALAGWERIEWKLAEPLKTKEIKIAHARYAQVAPTSMTGFVQVTFKIPSKQVFAAYRRRRVSGGAAGGSGSGGGNSSSPSSAASADPTTTNNNGDSEWELVAGDPQKVLDVTDYWVLERKTAADDRLNKEAAAATPGGGVGGGAGRAADPPGARWRLVARLALHPQQQQQQQQRGAEEGGAAAATAAGGGRRRAA
jgi:hypothetical protein